MAINSELDKKLRQAVRYFWMTRKRQAKKQGGKTGSRDAGARTAVTGGHQMDGFITLVRDYLCSNGLPETQVVRGKAVELPGWYRPEKQ
jgi:Restriction endonuclease XhoI